MTDSVRQRQYGFDHLDRHNIKPSALWAWPPVNKCPGSATGEDQAPIFLLALLNQDRLHQNAFRWLNTLKILAM